MASITQRVVRNARRRGVVVRDRKFWGNTSPVYQWRRIHKPHALLPGKPSDTLVQHITVTFDYLDLRKSMQLLHKIGMARFGSGVSYNFCISMKTGRVGVGQSLDAKGTHTVNYKQVPNFVYDMNYTALAIAFIGEEHDQLSDKAVHAAQQLVAAMVEEKALTPGHDYVPHNMFAFKACPGAIVEHHMQQIDPNYKH